MTLVNFWGGYIKARLRTQRILLSFSFFFLSAEAKARVVLRSVARRHGQEANVV